MILIYKKIIIVCFSVLALSCARTKVLDEITDFSQTGYDEILAEEVGADDYGMKKFVIAFLKRGPNRDRTKEESDRLQQAHLDNISKLAEEGLLVLAGPFLDDTDLRGIYIFDVETVEEAKALTETDPAIQAGSLIMELHPWYGSAATSLVGKWHTKIQKTEI